MESHLDAGDATADVWDGAEPAVLVHGSFAADPAEVWAKQRALAPRYRLTVVHRRGYGRAAPATGDNFTTDVADLLALLARGSDGGSGAHLVGASYGGVVALVAAGQRPDLVRSLALVEPPAFGIVDHPAVSAMVERLATLRPASRFTPEADRAGFIRALGGVPPDRLTLSPAERQSVLAAMAETPPQHAPVDLAALAAARIPALVVTGAWSAAFDAIAGELTRRLGAERAVIPGAGHDAQRSGAPFNARLLAFWQSVDR